MKKITGLAIHLHHGMLFEWCFDFDERVEDIKQNKPKHEQDIRLRLFKMLPNAAVEELPESLKKASTELEKSVAELQKADAEREKAYAEWKKAYAEWSESGQAAWHKRWCGCIEWDGREIQFNERKGEKP